MIDYNHFSKSVIGLVRKANEDSIGSVSKDHSNGNGSIHIVCDGMGGHVGGATASQTAIKSITEYFKSKTYSDPISALNQSIQYANKQIFNMAETDPSLKGMGTTIVVFLIKNDNIYIAHVGDSRVYLFSDSRLHRLTKDHSFVQKLVDAGQIDESEAENHPRKNELTRALGISSSVEVEVTKTPILPKKGDKFLLCSDGLCGLVNDPTIANAMKNSSVSSTVNDLISLAENAGGHDNISVDLIEISKSPHKRNVFIRKGNQSIEMTATHTVDPRKFKKKNNLPVILASVIILSLTLGGGYYTYKNGYFTDSNSSENTPTNKKIESDTKKIIVPEEDEKVKEAQKNEEEAKKRVEEMEKELNREKLNETDRKKSEEKLKRAEEKLKRLEEEKRIAEEEREKAEEDKRIADEKTEKAEEERKNSEEEARNTEEKRIKIEIESLKDKGYIDKKFDWDNKKLYTDEIEVGDKIFYMYSDEDKNINKKYTEEWKEMQKFIKEGWEQVNSDEKDKSYEYKSFFDPPSVVTGFSNKLSKKDIKKILEYSKNTIGKKSTLRKRKE